MKRKLFLTGCSILFLCIPVLTCGGCRSHKNVVTEQKDSLNIDIHVADVVKSVAISDSFEYSDSARVKVEFEQDKGMITLLADGSVGMSGVKTLTGEGESFARQKMVKAEDHDSIVKNISDKSKYGRKVERGNADDRRNLNIRVLTTVGFVLLITMTLKYLKAWIWRK